jgi:hypothetical protein
MHENDIGFLAPEYKQILGMLYILYAANSIKERQCLTSIICNTTCFITYQVSCA